MGWLIGVGVMAWVGFGVLVTKRLFDAVDPP